VLVASIATASELEIERPAGVGQGGLLTNAATGVAHGAGAAAVLSLRCLTDTTDRWSQFWGRIDREGFPVAA
jgi:hypothetical protein